MVPARREPRDEFGGCVRHVNCFGDHRSTERFSQSEWSDVGIGRRQRHRKRDRGQYRVVVEGRKGRRNTRLRVAASYEALRHFSELPGVELWINVDLEDRWQDLGSPILALGAELVAGEDDLFFVRAGYGQQQSGQSAGASVGLGVRYQQFDMGVAKRLSGSSLTGESEPVHISFGEPIVIQERGAQQHQQIINYIEAKLSHWSS